MRISDWSSDVCSSDLPVVILFTTGRGTPRGFPVPTIKVASNHDLAARKPGWIDFDGGQVLDDGMNAGAAALDRKSDAQGNRVSVRVDHGCCRINKKNNKRSRPHHNTNS